MQINEYMIKCALNAMFWVLEPSLEESILDRPNLLDLAKSNLEIAAIANDLCDSIFETIEIH